MRDIKDIKKSIDELFELQKRLRYSTSELAKMINVDVRTIYRWKIKESIPRPVYIPMINKLIEIGKKGKL